jgi:hypothetical protein
MKVKKTMTIIVKSLVVSVYNILNNKKWVLPLTLLTLKVAVMDVDYKYTGISQRMPILKFSQRRNILVLIGITNHQ